MNASLLFRALPQLADIVVGPPPPPLLVPSSFGRSGIVPFVLAFVLTVLLEWPILAWLSGLGFKRTGLFCLCLNGASWGVAMGILVLLPIPIPMVEAAIILVEAALLFWYWRWRLIRAFGISAAMNLTSWLIGVPLFALLS